MYFLFFAVRGNHFIDSFLMLLQDYVNSEIDFKIVVGNNSTTPEGMDVKELIVMFAEIVNSLGGNVDSQNLTQKLVNMSSEVLTKTGIGSYLGHMLGIEQVPYDLIMKMIENITMATDFETAYPMLMDQMAKFLIATGLNVYVPVDITELEYSEMMNMFEVFTGNGMNMQEL